MIDGNIVKLYKYVLIHDHELSLELIYNIHEYMIIWADNPNYSTSKSVFIDKG